MLKTKHARRMYRAAYKLYKDTEGKEEKIFGRPSFRQWVRGVGRSVSLGEKLSPKLQRIWNGKDD